MRVWGNPDPTTQLLNFLISKHSSQNSLKIKKRILGFYTVSKAYSFHAWARDLPDGSLILLLPPVCNQQRNPYQVDYRRQFQFPAPCKKYSCPPLSWKDVIIPHIADISNRERHPRKPHKICIYQDEMWTYKDTVNQTPKSTSNFSEASKTLHNIPPFVNGPKNEISCHACMLEWYLLPHRESTENIPVAQLWLDALHVHVLCLKPRLQTSLNT